MRFLVTGKLIRLAQTQWQPTLTVHDPNPPITIESAPVSQAVFWGWHQGWESLPEKVEVMSY